MRIIAGSLKRRSIKAPSGTDTRPTSDRLRESLFSILGSDRVQGARVLDLFAGTGALGMEALSRGALSAVFVEQHPQALKVLYYNIENLGLEDRSRIIKWNIRKDLRCLRNEAPFDLIFMDPPYGRGLTAITLEHLKKSGLLTSASCIICEHTAEDPLPPEKEGFIREDLRVYGKTLLARLSFLSDKEESH
ncbi:16S rRNA (guanine(966)-N(2))-methyltransferase RsmD [Desulfobotulus mexicanus]|uniref:16S rRNA (Guanine(966)-N(2))-methyltransferase RsmD n=1 Tax=Desulfobotulus mexicanus TaxID=2586642 RepID=A0A5Q4VIW8_9BACT|nr:16S rRNA (guanine(966)-N(2))-methyltransferase RsmD [Desulfobotulus mexicanus]TYT76157.1 16S rRNA (guanine(966)-N(2))-methyltransferase RsmD [Desulfobotulus mexicanus]